MSERSMRLPYGKVEPELKHTTLGGGHNGVIESSIVGKKIGECN